MASIPEILAQIRAMREGAEQAAGMARNLSEQARTVKEQIGGLAGDALAGVAQEAYVQLQAVEQHAEDAINQAGGAMENLDSWYAVIESAGGA